MYKTFLSINHKKVYIIYIYIYFMFSLKNNNFYGFWIYQIFVCTAHAATVCWFLNAFSEIEEKY